MWEMPQKYNPQSVIVLRKQVGLHEQQLLFFWRLMENLRNMECVKRQNSQR